MIQLEFRVLLLHELSDGLPPQSRSSENVGLVDGVHGEGRGFGSSDLAGDSSDAFDFRDRVGHLVPGDSRSVNFLTVAEVDATDELEEGGKEEGGG